MKVKIIVCYHKPGEYISNDIYLPIHVGKSLAKISLPIQGDDIGENISDMNNLYCELTGLYWAWKNLDADYIGLCHYRRFFTFERNLCRSLIHKVYVKIRNVKDVFSRHPLSYADTDEIVVKDDGSLYDKANYASIQIKKYLVKNPQIKIVALKPINLGFINNHIYFSIVAGRFHLDIIRNIIATKYPKLLENFDKELSSNKLHFANMTICSRDIIDDYCTFLFTILEEHRRLVIKEKFYDNLHEKSLSRLSGYLAEILTSTFISYIKKSHGAKSVKLLTLLRADL